MQFGIVLGDPWIARRIPRLVPIVISSILVVIISAASVESVPNIRIQVNNENLQNPPYLLDALKQVEKAEQKAAAEATAAAASVVSNQNNFNDGATAQGHYQSGSNLAAASSQPDEQSSIVGSQPALQDANKAETGDEIPSLDSESVLKLSPESIIGSASMESLEQHPAEGSSSSSSSSSLAQESSVAHEDKQDEFKQANNNNNNRHFQLDVTSSHLKRPSAAVSSAELIDEELSGGESAQQTTLIRPQQAAGQQQQQLIASSNSGLGGGAKSHVSPSVANEEGQASLLPQQSSGSTSGASATQAAKLEEKIAAPASPPDTWEPSQVMQGVTNASLVPATIKRQYGHQTRTRVTLGGGYQREQQPPLVNPSSSEYVDSKPEKPVAPLERPTREHQSTSVSVSSSSSSLDNSRVIEVPERIIVPVSVFNKQSSANQNNTTATRVTTNRKRDARCPSNGVTSMEHPAACDKYYLCEDGYSSEQTCPNGLMYGTRDIVRDFCVHRWQAVCGDKSIPNPISSPGCRWQNGIFNVQGSPKCTPDFYECVDGLFEVKKCTVGGQVYDDKTKSCQFAELVGCTQEALADFQCPTDDQSNTYWPFPRYFLNERALIHCVSDKPQIIRCRDHERVDPEHLFCVPIDKSAPPVNEDGSPAEVAVSARRATNTQREKGKKVQKTTENK
uniref:Chitin-binding type-2 domain-containing protein n=1 Tax=Aceria tosichella TaxID=561515 RepID=A0A6G1SG23_9ACAR